MYEFVAGMDNAIAGPSGAHNTGAVDGVDGACGAGNSSAEENIYESVDEVRQRHLMSNIDVPGCSYVSGIYGRLDVIGHGIGRIERHLSSSCGSGIDTRYSYPNLQPPAVPPTTPHPFPGGYATLPTSATGGGHLHSIRPHYHPHPPPAVPLVSVSSLALAGAPSGSSGGSLMREVAPAALSAVSVQWLLVNKWLPLWIASSDGGGHGGGGAHYYCHGTTRSSSSTAATYYHYQQHQHQMDVSDYYCLAQHQQQHQQLHFQQAPSVVAAAIQSGTNNNTNNIAVASGSNSTGSTTGAIPRRGASTGNVVLESGERNGEGNAGIVRDGGASPPPQQQQSSQHQQ